MKTHLHLRFICLNIYIKAKLCLKSPFSMPSTTVYVLRKTTLTSNIKVYVQVNNTCLYVVTIGKLNPSTSLEVIGKIKCFTIS